MNVAKYLQRVMNTTDIEQILNELFSEPLTRERNRHIIFWYDDAREFTDKIDTLSLPNVRIWKFSEHNLFATKYELEVNDLTSHFLLYTNAPKPAPREDWFYNLYKLGAEFTADKLTIYMRKLGIEDDSLRPLFMEYSQFFNSNVRFESFRKYPTENYTEEMIDINVLSALTRSRLNTLDEILRALFTDIVQKKYDTWTMIKKYGCEEKFWALIEKYYGYNLERKTLEDLVRFFMMTYTVEQNVDIFYPKTWLHYVSPRPTNAIVLMSQWMNHREDRHIFHIISDVIADVAKIDMHIAEWSVDEIAFFDTFRVFDERIIQFLLDQLMNDVGQFDMYESLILSRRTTYWYDEYVHIYNCLLQTVRFYQLSETYTFMEEQSAIELYSKYTESYYLFDTYYRKFYVAYDALSSKEILLPLREKLENSYNNWFMNELATCWMNGLENEKNKWFLRDVIKQSDFFSEYVQPFIQSNQRVFVIISDAMRYEVAKELSNSLHNEQKATTELTNMQGIIPSYTALGMASLLPHEQLHISDVGDVFIDGKRASSTKQRTAILQASIPESNAYTFTELNEMDRKELREAIQRLKVIYIYHNTIDAIGDNSATEMDVFTGAEEAKKEVKELIQRLVSNVSASNILITADHGFIYQRNKIEKTHLLNNNIANPILRDRRFIISERFDETPATLSYPLGHILLDKSNHYVTIPKGIHRFHTQGTGANYAHGGAMLQEIVIPVITYKTDRSKSERNVVRHVDVKITNLSRKITSEVIFLEFFQINSVEEKALPLRLLAYFSDEDGNVISSECLLIADIRADEAFERTWKERFIFKSIHYDRTKNYYLHLDYEDGTKYERYPFTIDIL